MVKDYEHYIGLSQQCFPIKSLSYIKDYLSQKKGISPFVFYNLSTNTIVETMFKYKKNEKPILILKYLLRHILWDLIRFIPLFFLDIKLRYKFYKQYFAFDLSKSKKKNGKLANIKYILNYMKHIPKYLFISLLYYKKVKSSYVFKGCGPSICLAYKHIDYFLKNHKLKKYKPFYYEFALEERVVANVLYNYYVENPQEFCADCLLTEYHIKFNDSDYEINCDSLLDNEKFKLTEIAQKRGFGDGPNYKTLNDVLFFRKLTEPKAREYIINKIHKHIAIDSK